MSYYTYPTEDPQEEEDILVLNMTDEFSRILGVEVDFYQVRPGDWTFSIHEDQGWVRKATFPTLDELVTWVYSEYDNSQSGSSES